MSCLRSAAVNLIASPRPGQRQSNRMRGSRNPLPPLPLRSVERDDCPPADDLGRVPCSGRKVETVAGLQIVGVTENRDSKESLDNGVALVLSMFVLRENGSLAVCEHGDLIALALQKTHE